MCIRQEFSPEVRRYLASLRSGYTFLSDAAGVVTLLDLRGLSREVFTDQAHVTNLASRSKLQRSRAEHETLVNDFWISYVIASKGTEGSHRELEIELETGHVFGC